MRLAKFVSACLCSGVLVSAVFLTLVPLTAHAGGSVDHDALCCCGNIRQFRFVQKTRITRGNGTALRSHGVQPEHAGERISAFQFLASPKVKKGHTTCV